MSGRASSARVRNGRSNVVDPSTPKIVLLFGSSPEPDLVAQRLLVQVHDREPEVRLSGAMARSPRAPEQRLGGELEQVVLFVLDLQVRAGHERALVLDHHFADDVVHGEVDIQRERPPIEKHLHAPLHDVEAQGVARRRFAGRLAPDDVPVLQALLGEGLRRVVHFAVEYSEVGDRNPFVREILLDSVVERLEASGR